MSEEKRKVGRPKLFTDPDELQRQIDAYFDKCDRRLKQKFVAKTGEVVEVLDPEPYTMSGLAYELGMDRKSLINYSRDDVFFHTVKDARAKVERDVEARMNDKDQFTPGLIFNAKNNFGWKDKTETDVTTNGESINPYSKLTTEELRKLAGN